MKNSNKTLLIAGALATTLLAGGVAVAGGKGGCSDKDGHRGQWSAEHGSKKMEKRLDRLASKLELSDEQKAEVATIMQANRDKQQAMREQNREAFKAELGSVLSAEQMQEFETLMEKRGGKHQKRMQQKAES